MNKGNLENVLGGSFTVSPGLNGEVDSSVDHEPLLPGVGSPTIEFDKTYDAARLETIEGHAPKYKDLIGRFNPFDYQRMKISVGTWSVLINKAVVTFEDAIEHALALCRLWVQEDEELARIAEQREVEKVKKEVKAKTEILIEGTHAYNVEQARLAWKEAVRLRNETVKQWDEYVKAKREEYRQLRDA